MIYMRPNKNDPNKMLDDWTTNAYFSITNLLVRQETVLRLQSELPSASGG
jgi:hypothetical protein